MSQRRAESASSLKIPPRKKPAFHTNSNGKLFIPLTKLQWRRERSWTKWGCCEDSNGTYLIEMGKGFGTGYMDHECKFISEATTALTALQALIANQGQNVSLKGALSNEVRTAPERLKCGLSKWRGGRNKNTCQTLTTSYKQRGGGHLMPTYADYIWKW